MKRMMGLVCTNYMEGDFGLLTKERPIATIPYGGRYRLVDFPLSNMVNSGITTVGLITPHRYRSLLDHVGNGKEWALGRRVGGMFVLPGSIYGIRNATGKFLLRDLLGNHTFFERTARELVVISASSTVYNIDFRQVAEAHEKTGASVTLLYKRADGGVSGKNSLICDETGRVTALSGEAQEEEANVFMDAMIIDRELLLRFLDWYKNQSYLDLMDIIREDLEQIRVYGYQFDGYVRSISNASDYMDASMELLDPAVIKELFMGERQIRTKVQDAHPAKYGPNGSSRNAMIATGCVIKGTIENSIVFRGCTVGEGAVVRNSVLLPNTVLEEGVALDRVICDKSSHISKGVSLTGTVERPLIVNLRETKK